MKPKKRYKEETQLFQQDLEYMLDQRQALFQAANRIDWDTMERDFEHLYSDIGSPALPTRLMAGLLLLKQLENLSDERVCAAWHRDPYMQYFCGEQFLQWKVPCDPSELVHFRNRIGTAGVQRILEATLDLHRDKIEREDELVADTTVQEADIAFPTDTRLRVDCIEELWRMGDEPSSPSQRTKLNLA